MTNWGEKKYWLGFSAFNGIGPKRFALLKNYFGSAKRAWKTGEEELLAVGLERNLVTGFVKFRQNLNLDSYFLRLRENKMECYFLDDKFYPENLKKIDNPPFVLYVKGSIKPGDGLSIAVVGTRKMSFYGREVTETLVGDLVAAGLTVVSGLARGVDTTAHTAALNAGGRTIGVLGCGLDIIYPPENTPLVKKIIGRHGAVVSEFPLGMAAVPGNFPARNRIISGLSLGTLVIEGAQDSGAMITARHAAEQGREVFAVPGPITSLNSAGPFSLIKNGAKLVSNVNDILEELNLESRIKNTKSRKILADNPEEQAIVSLLTDRPKSLDEIVRELGWETGRVLSLISLMEIKGFLKNSGGKAYLVKNQK